MFIFKITEGHVVQKFNAKTGQCISQEFVASDPVEFEDENGIVEDNKVTEKLYFPFQMTQPQRD